MGTTVIRFRGALTPRIIERAGGLTISQEQGVMVLSGDISPADLRALIDALVESDHELVDVAGARPEQEV
jgi:hypothetical protein